MSGELEPSLLRCTRGFLTCSGSVLYVPITFHNGILLHTSKFIIPWVREHSVVDGSHSYSPLS